MLKTNFDEFELELVQVVSLIAHINSPSNGFQFLEFSVLNFSYLDMVTEPLKKTKFIQKIPTTRLIINHLDMAS